MGIVRNIITIPPAAAATATVVAGTPTKAAAAPAPNSGAMYNGHTRIFAEVAPGTSDNVKIKFSVEINSVDGREFNIWRRRVSKILGPDEEKQIASYSGIASDPDEPERYASQYSLAAFSYVITGKYDSYDNQSAVSFDSQPGREFNVMRSIFLLDSPMIKLAGELTATTANPKVCALIGATYFSFANKKVTSFASYRGPIVLVDGEEEFETHPGILAPV